MGPDDEVGSLNYLGTEEVVAAARLVTSGKTFTLQRLIGDPKGDPVWPGRTPAERTQILDEGDWDEGGRGPACPGGLHDADDKINAFLQGSTQYDGLGHVWHPALLRPRRDVLRGLLRTGPGLQPRARAVVRRHGDPNLVTDTIANEVTFHPDNGVALVLHNALMGNLGVTLTEIADLEKLADDCAEDGQYAFLYVAAPLEVAKGSGSSVHPVVIE